MKNPNFDEALHPRDEKGRWAEKASAAIKAAGKEIGKAVKPMYKAKATVFAKSWRAASFATGPVAHTLGHRAGYASISPPKKKESKLPPLMQPMYKAKKEVATALVHVASAVGNPISYHSGRLFGVNDAIKAVNAAKKAPQTLGKKGSAKKTQLRK